MQQIILRLEQNKMSGSWKGRLSIKKVVPTFQLYMLTLCQIKEQLYIHDTLLFGWSYSTSLDADHFVPCYWLNKDIGKEC